VKKDVWSACGVQKKRPKKKILEFLDLKKHQVIDHAGEGELLHS